jgi:hypothetical protein
MCKYFVDNNTASNKENVDLVETDDWLHRNDSYHTNNILMRICRLDHHVIKDAEIF